MVRVKRITGGLMGLASAVLLLWHAGAAPAVDPNFVVDSYEDGANIHRARPFKRSPVRAVVIEENAAKSFAGQTAPDDCSRFVVNAAQVRQYFSQARAVGKRAYSHELEWSPCFASGTLTLADGRRAIWSVQQYGLGSLYLAHHHHYFHCAKCSIVNLAPTPQPK